MNEQNKSVFNSNTAPDSIKGGANDHILDIHSNEKNNSDVNFDASSFSEGIPPFLKTESDDWKLSNIQTPHGVVSLSDFSLTPMGNEHTLTHDNLASMGNPITDKNMIVEEPSSENDHKMQDINNTPSDMAKAYASNISNASDSLRTAVLKKMKKSYNGILKKPRPAFINKVWLMVNDESTDDCICWAEDGQSFIITHQIDFVTKVLPKYFKHCKIASFIRQLNMYGWKKLQDAKSGGLNDPNEEKLQFYNENFIKGRQDLLDFINRQKPHNQNQSFSGKNNQENSRESNAHNMNRVMGSDTTGNNSGLNSRNSINSSGLSWKMPQYIPLSNTMNSMNLIEASSQNTEASKNNAVAVMTPGKNVSKTHIAGLDTSVLLQEFETLKYNQISMAEDLKRLANQNDVLWKQNVDTRKRLQKQENALQQILKFMSNYFGPGVQRLIQQEIGNIKDASNQENANTSSDIIEEHFNSKKTDSSNDVVDLEETPSKNQSRTNSASRQINTGNGTTAQIQEILDDDLIDSPNANNNTNAPIIDEVSPQHSTDTSSNKKFINSPMVQSVESNKSPESIEEILDSNNMVKDIAGTPKFDFNTEHTPLSESNMYKPFKSNSNIPISRDKYGFAGISGDYDEKHNSGLNILDDHNNYTDILSNLQENIKKQEEHLNGFSQILTKLQATEETDDHSTHNQNTSADSPLIHPFDLNDYLSTTPSTPSMFNIQRPMSVIADRPIVEEVSDPDFSSNKRKVSVEDLDISASPQSKKAKKD